MRAVAFTAAMKSDLDAGWTECRRVMGVWGAKVAVVVGFGEKMSSSRLGIGMWC